MKPVGQFTRGTTGSNRLRRFDRWTEHLCARRLRRGQPLCVDLGFGSSPTTTVEWQRSLRALNPRVRVVGVEIDPERVRLAAPTIDAIHGGFEIPTHDRPLVIRAANVLRQYDRDDVAGAWTVMQQRLATGGWLIDGTCDEQGRLTAMLSLDASAARWFTLSVRLAGLERPSQVAARLPKALIHDNYEGSPIHALLTDLDRAWERGARWGARQRWIEMAAVVKDRWEVRDGPGRWRLGEITVPARAVLDP